MEPLDAKTKILASLNSEDLYQAEVENFSRSDDGDLARGSCPLHDGGNNSLYVNLKDGLFKCFGCGTGGSILDFYQAKYGADEKTILAFLNEIAKKKNDSGEPERVNSSEEEIITEDENNTDEEKTTHEVEDTEPETHSEGFYFERELYHSPTFLS